MAILQLIINGIALGALYALVTLGFVFVINATGAVNFAQGELVMAGGTRRSSSNRSSRPGRSF